MRSSFAVQLDQFFGGIPFGINQRRDDPRPMRAAARAADAEGDLPQRQGLARQGLKAFTADPLRTSGGEMRFERFLDLTQREWESSQPWPPVEWYLSTPPS